MPKLFWRIFLILWLSIIGFSSLVAIIGDQVARNSGAQDMTEILKLRLPPLLKDVKKSLEQEGPQAARHILRQAPPGIRNLVIVTDNEQQELLGRRQFQRHRHNPARDRPNRSMEVIDPAGNHWTIRVSPLVPPRILFSPGYRGTIARLLLAALLSAVVSWILARSLARPLLQLGSTSVALAQGKLESRVSGKITRRRDEVGDLARSFNQMAAEIETLDRSRQRLLRDVAHELRSPLARMQVAVELARDKGDSPEGDHQDGGAELNLIAREIQRLEKMIAEVLTLLREAGSVQALEKEAYSLAALMEGLLSRVNYEADAKNLGRVKLNLEGDVELFINPELIYRALENLLRNASRLTDVSRGVEIYVDPVGTGSSSCCIKIRDYGPGVPEEFIQHLFEPFSRLSSARERTSGDDGWGLGTAIAAAAISRHGGTIEASNAVGGGLEITIHLPLDG
ncbi:MAG: HAMP domain-containing protein [Proteobacteria bacterium]|nr:HAMP domain-containing protein [Pseudomonadota bacterium]